MSPLPSRPSTFKTTSLFVRPSRSSDQALSGLLYATTLTATASPLNPKSKTNHASFLTKAQPMSSNGAVRTMLASFNTRTKARKKSGSLSFPTK